MLKNGNGRTPQDTGHRKKLRKPTKNKKLKAKAIPSYLRLVSSR